MGEEGRGIAGQGEESSSGSLPPLQGKGPKMGNLATPRPPELPTPCPGVSPVAHSGGTPPSLVFLHHSSPHPISPVLASSLDLFFRWLFDKKFLAEAAIRFE